MHTLGNTPYVLIAMAGLFGAVFLGLVAVVLPYWFIIALLVLLLGLVLAWRWPEYGVVLVLLLMSGLVPPWFTPRLPLMGGTIKGEDVLFLLLLFMTLFRLLAGRQTMQGVTRYFWPLGLLAILGVISLAYALFYANNPAKNVLAEAEALLYWAMIPLVAIVADSEKKVRRLALALAGLGLVLAIGLSVQSLTGQVFIYGGRVEIAETLGKHYSDVLRSTAPGIFLVIFGILFFVARRLLKVDGWLFSLMAIAVLALGLMFTFGRTLWGATAMGLILMAGMLGLRTSLKLALVGGVSLSLVLAALVVAKPELVDALGERVMSVDKEVEQGQSLAWRYQENGYALAALQRSPLVGVGLGGDYKPVLKAGDPEQARFIHSGYMYLVLKLGLLAVIPLVWLYVSFVRQALAVRHAQEDPRLRAIVLSAFSVALLPLATALTRPEWMSPETVASIAAFMGLIVAVARIHRRAS